MKRTSTFTGAAVLAALALSLLTACKGRTMENMQPTGDTVQVDPTVTYSDSERVIVTETGNPTDTIAVDTLPL